MIIIFTGPNLTTKIEKHQMIRAGYDLIVIGGATIDKTVSNSLFKLSCADQNCTWQTLNISLKHARSDFVAVAVPDMFLEDEVGAVANDDYEWVGYDTDNYANVVNITK